MTGRLLMWGAAASVLLALWPLGFGSWWQWLGTAVLLFIAGVATLESDSRERQ